MGIFGLHFDLRQQSPEEEWECLGSECQIQDCLPPFVVTVLVHWKCVEAIYLLNGWKDFINRQLKIGLKRSFPG